MECNKKQQTIPFWISLMSGGAAGFTVDLVLYPLDTIKTRMQAHGGFFKNGGFRGIYSGIGAVAMGSVPGAGLFFSSYDTAKSVLSSWDMGIPSSAIHMTAASFGELMACTVRVPTEIVKQRMQAGLQSSLQGAVLDVLSSEGVGGFYRGFGATLIREIPFSFIQFPIYERLKVGIEDWRGTPPLSYEAALCGSFAGAFSAAVTTPLDVLKTRLMLSDAKDSRYRVGTVAGLRSLYEEGGIRVLFAGVQPRVMWISIGGFFSSELMKWSRVYW